jgi:nucleotide-binding universal stress UspA family protein
MPQYAILGLALFNSEFLGDTEREAPAMYKHILIPTDGSELAGHAVTQGLSLAKLVGAKVSVIVVEAPFDVLHVRESRARHLSEEFEQHTQQIKRHAEAVLSHAAGKAKAVDVPCDTMQVEHDQPYQAIISAANDKGCDLIVMASHGRSGISAVLLGSVTNKVLTHTKTPVLVCH